MVVFDDREFLYMLLELYPSNRKVFLLLAPKLKEMDGLVFIEEFSRFLVNQFGNDENYLHQLLTADFQEFLNYAGISFQEIETYLETFTF